MRTTTTRSTKQVIHVLYVALMVMLVAGALPQASHAQTCAKDGAKKTASEETASASFASADFDMQTLAPSAAATAPKPFILAAQTPEWRANFGKQLDRGLRSRIPVVREQMMQTILVLARTHEDKKDFARAIPALLSIYGNDRDEAHRFMALVTLHAIANDYAMQGVGETAALGLERSKRIQRHTNIVLGDYYAKNKAALWRLQNRR